MDHLPERWSPVTAACVKSKNIKRAAEIRNDMAAKCLRGISCEDGNERNDEKIFLYHDTNKHYKSYTHTNKLKAVNAKSKQVD